MRETKVQPNTSRLRPHSHIWLCIKVKVKVEKSTHGLTQKKFKNPTWLTHVDVG